MDENRLRFGVGVLVIAAIGVGVILTFLFGAFPAILNSEYVILVKFRSAEGINTNTPVTRDGVKIGRVEKIQLIEEGGVTLSLAIDKEHQLTTEYIPQIGIGSLITGDSKLEFKKATSVELRKIFANDLDMIGVPYVDGNFYDVGKKLDDPFTLLFGMEDELRDTFISIRGAGDAVQNVGTSIETLVNDVRGVIGVAPAPAASSPNQQRVNPGASGFPSGHLRMPSPSSLSDLPPAPPWAKPVFLTSTRKPHSADQNTLLHQSQPVIAQTAAFQNPGAANPIGVPLAIPPGTRPTLADVAEQAIETLEEFQGAVRDARQILGSEVLRDNLDASAQRLPGLLDDAAETLRTTQQTFDSFRRVGEQLEQVGSVAQQAIGGVSGTLDSFRGTAENVERFTEPLAERGGEIVEAALRTLHNLDATLVQLSTFGQTLNNNDGTLRRVIEDDELYFEIRRTVENIEAATARIRPILDDVRVFTDKIARDPRQLGIRGALTSRPSGMGLK
ncbi:MAG: MlaD family protein [Planctomycetota bacterium]